LLVIFFSFQTVADGKNNKGHK